MKTESFRMAFETEKDITWMVVIEELFKHLKGESDVEKRKNIEDEIREQLKRYRREFGKTAVEPYYEELKKFKK
ncbi:MAG: hypothetical protein WC445_00250 [Patescibacteria group bacterium]